MKFLANENFPRPSTILLRQRGYYVFSIAEERPGISDREVVNIARSKDLIILTFDKDYGEIIFNYGESNPPSVIIFRDKGNDPHSAGKLLLQLIETKKIHFQRTFTAVDKQSVRQRRY